MKRMLALIMTILLCAGIFSQIVSAEEAGQDFLTEEEFSVESMSVGDSGRETNTDSDTEDVDGTYAFIGNEDWFGWESYLNYNPDENVYISGRVYLVDLPEDGRLKIELTADNNVFLEARIGAQEDNYSNETIWEAGSTDQPINFCETSGMLKKGTYRVLFAYQMDSKPEIIFNWPPGKKYFFHKVTFLTLNENEEAAFNVMQMIEALPSSRNLTLSDEAKVEAVQSAYDRLTEEQKAIVGDAYAEDLADCTDRIAELKFQALISIEDAKVTGIKSKTYNAKAQIQSPVVKADGRTLTAGIDYTLTYKSNKNVGKATIIITGTGQYTGSIKKPFRINPMPATITTPAGGTKAITVKWQKQITKMSKSRITGYQVQYSTSKDFSTGVKSKYVTGYGKSYVKISKLKAKKTYYVRVRTYMEVNGTKYYSTWSKTKAVKTK